MTDNGERQLPENEKHAEELLEAVRETIDDWVVEEEVAVKREGSQIVAEEGELVENISFMVALALDEFTE